ncbi:hypothetical protein LguiB_029565 [Lonicera macranthoides]
MEIRKDPVSFPFGRFGVSKIDFRRCQNNIWLVAFTHHERRLIKVPIMLTGGNVTVGKKFYMCPHYHRNEVGDSGAVCPQCQQSMVCAVPYVERVFSAKAGTDDGSLSRGWLLT